MVTPSPPTVDPQRKPMARLAPTLITLGNLLCGFGAVVVAAESIGVRVGGLAIAPLALAAWLIFIGMVLDALDGYVARLTHQATPLGAQLDSMADLVTFGVAPALLALKGSGVVFAAAVVVACVYVACCAVRLARFNLTSADDEHRTFRGLPSPAAAGAVASLMLLIEHFQLGAPATIALRVITSLAAIAMISPIPYPHVVNRLLRGRHYAIVAIALFIAAALTAVHPPITLAAGFFVYAVLGPFVTFIGRGARG